MKYYNGFLPNYSVGVESYKAMPWITRRYGKKGSCHWRKNSN